MLSHISFASIPVDSFDRAKAFYVDVLGMTVVTDAPYGPDRWIMLEIPGARTRLHLGRRQNGVQPPPHPVVPLIAPDVPAAVAALRARGVAVAVEPKLAEWDPGVTYAMIRDSEGNLVLIASR